MNGPTLRQPCTSLLPLQVSGRNGTPIVCIPGAGASVTAFVDLAEALGNNWPVYGIQPLGLYESEQPHQSVEDTAIYNLHAIASLSAAGPIHLLGHSHGGLAAFEMALRLRHQNRTVYSLTLIDSEPPDKAGTRHPSISNAEVTQEFLEVVEDVHDSSLDISLAPDDPDFLIALHAALVGARRLSPQSRADVLRGSLATYTAARRCRYTPHAPYAGPVRLALATANRRSTPEIMLNERRRYAAEWKLFAPDLETWYGAGNHFSILRSPEVESLAKWWRQPREPITGLSPSSAGHRAS